ncbi:GTP-binding protein [Candidatus Epulonipiscium viviparus]|uniref:GTP-binding protein n=1 Tax=Candidatus Epulonipiscium viviparus TaxID=420336 RepID=UPI00016C0061|nr:GTP-binding protein [Candidatus Epulopiscium viviparus]
MNIDIITGFLGAGKTTFITKYALYLREFGEKILIIENEFGLAGIDGAFLRENELEVTEISGGCVCCTQKEKLIAFILEAVQQGFDRVIIEPSGIYNLDTFFSLWNNPQIAKNCILNSIVTIVKPDFMKFATEAYEHIFLSHFYSTGAIVVSDTQSYTEAEIDSTIIDLTKFVSSKNTNFDLSKIDVYTKNWIDLTDNDMHALSSAGRSECPHTAINECHLNLIENHFFMARLKTYDNILELIDYILQNDEIFRIKGYALAGDKLYSINCTQNCIEIKPGKSKHAVLNILGQNLDITSIEKKVREMSQIRQMSVTTGSRLRTELI